MKSQSSNNEFQVQIRSFCEIAIFSQRVSRGRECQNKHIKFDITEKSPPISAAGLLGLDLVYIFAWEYVQVCLLACQSAGGYQRKHLTYRFLNPEVC